MDQNRNHVQQIMFSLEDMYFEYDDEKNNINIQKHGISFEMATRVFLDYDRIELFDEEHSFAEDRYNTIGSIIGAIADEQIKMVGAQEDIVFVVYTERIRTLKDGKEIDVIRLISARMATNFERGLYYGKIN